MNSKTKYIGINQRIPFEVLDSAIFYFLENEVIDKKYINQSMKQFTSGTNRANKASNYVAQILKRQSHILDILKNRLKGILYTTLRLEDRKAFCLCLISLTYPITYDLLVALAQSLKIQKQVNKRLITEKITSIYGSNRTVDIAIDALLPIIIELGPILRTKVSLYSMGSKLIVRNNFISELIIYTDVKLSGSKSILIEDLNFKPWYSYFDIFSIKTEKLSSLIKKKESAIGKGYLTIS
jgi:hypothetical protein